MAKFAFLELHVDEASVTANAPFSGSSGRGSADGTDIEVTEEEDEGGVSLGLLVGLAALLVGVALLRRLLQGEAGESEPESDLTVLP